MAYTHENRIHPISHEQLNKDSIQAAKMFYDPPEYEHDLAYCYIMGFDAGRYDTLVTMQTREKPDCKPGSIEASLHYHAAAYMSGYESISEFVGHVRLIIMLHDSREQDDVQVDIPAKPVKKCKPTDSNQLSIQF